MNKFTSYSSITLLSAMKRQHAIIKKAQRILDAIRQEFERRQATKQK